MWVEIEEMNERRRARCQADGIRVGEAEYSVFHPEDVPDRLARDLPPEDADTETLMAELNALCGLGEVKEHVAGLIRMAESNKIRRERGFPVPPLSLHMVFEGNPGTGKTTVAGLMSRFSNILTFRDYSLEELTEILRSLCREYRYVMTPEAEARARRVIRQGMEERNFSNGRFVRNLFGKIVNAQARRVMERRDTSEEALTTLTEEDI